MYELLRFILSYQTTVLKKVVQPSKLSLETMMTVRSAALRLSDVFGIFAILFHILNSQNTVSKEDRERSTTKLGVFLLRSSADCADALGDFERISLCGPTCTRCIRGTDKFPSSLMACRPVLRRAAVNDDPIGSSTYSMPWENSRLL
jgi:hypothetical protein